MKTEETLRELLTELAEHYDCTTEEAMDLPFEVWSVHGKMDILSVYVDEDDGLLIIDVQ